MYNVETNARTKQKKKVANRFLNKMLEGYMREVYVAFFSLFPNNLCTIARMIYNFRALEIVNKASLSVQKKNLVARVLRT